MKARITLLALAIVGLSLSSKAQDTTYVEFIDGTKKYGSVEVVNPFLQKSKIVLDDTTEYSLSQVLAYQTDEGFYRRIENKNDKFAKRIEKGNISLYSRAVTNYSPTHMPGPGGTSTYVGGGFSEGSVEYFSKNGSALLKANIRNLKPAMADNPKSMSYLDRRGGYTFLQVIGAIAGVTIVTLGITSQADKDPEEMSATPLVLGAAVFSGGLWLPHFGKRSLKRKAIKAYNQPEEL